MSAARRIANNTVYLFAGNVFKKLLTFFMTLVVARYLGAENFGKLSFALGFVALFTIITDFGARILINREIARHKKDVNKYVSNVVILKFTLSFLMLFLIHIFALILDYSGINLQLIYLASIVYILQSLGQPFGSAFRGYELMKYDSFSLMFQSLVKFILALFVVFLGLTVRELMIFYIISEAAGLVLRIIYYHTRIHPLKLEWDAKFSKDIVKRSIPFGVAALFMTFYDKIDVTMLSKMVANPDTAIGWYSAAYNLLFVFEFIPISVCAAVYPYASNAYLKSMPKFKYIYRKLLTYNFYLTMPLAVGTMVLADKVIELLYGPDFTPAVFALKILIWSVVFKFQIYSLGVVLNSMNQEKLTMKATIASLGINIVLNLLLIPKYSFIGASIATIFSEAVYFVICYSAIHLMLVKLNILKLLYKPLIASVLMGLAVYFTDLNIFAGAALGVLVYVALMYILNAVPRSDVRFFSDYFKGLLSRWF